MTYRATRSLSRPDDRGRGLSLRAAFGCNRPEYQRFRVAGHPRIEILVARQIFGITLHVIDVQRRLVSSGSE